MKKIEADVVVIAAGMSGLTASVAAAEKGVSVVVFEKGGTTGGAANMGMGFFAVESKYQKAQMYGFTVDEAFEEFMTYNHWRSDARLVKKYMKQSASTVEWLEKMGVEFLGAYQYFLKSRATWHVVKAPGSNKPSERCASIMIKALTDRANELGVDFRFYTPAKEILVGDKGQVVGVRAQSQDGEEIICDCSCVIVGTGGIGDNPQMIKEYMGWEWGKDLFTFRIPGLVGDGMKMCWAIGAGKSDINMEITYNTPGTTDIYKTLSETMRQPNLMVNLQGLRFINEEIMMNTTFTGNAINLQTNRCGFSIINDEVLNYYRKNGLDFVTHHHAVKTIEKWDSELKSYTSGEKAEDSGLSALHNDEEVPTNMWACDTLEEVAAVTGINLKNLKQTIDEYNADANGYDTLFNKPARYMKPIVGGKYYVARHFPSGYGSLGGIKINDNLEIVTQKGDKIPGLYGCGTDVNTMFGDSYIFIQPGNTMGFAINSGRMAGANAVGYLDSDDYVE